MKYSYNWLKDYYKSDKSVEQTGEDLVALGSDVEEILPKDTRVGEPPVEIAGSQVFQTGRSIEAQAFNGASKPHLKNQSRLNLNDSVLELEITPNRGDLLSHFGLARDLTAKAGRLLEKPELELKESSEKTADEIKIKIESDKCSLYLAKIIKGIKIAPSPKWLQDKLLAVGAKPINNVVDATNYIMLDLGHPLHAFDKSKIAGGEIVVKEIDADMEVVTLDGEARELISGMLGIWDGERPVAIAGVMGLKNSEVDQNTTDIALEAAVFDRKSVRKTAKLLNLKTEASARFERGVDGDGVRYAIDKAAKLIAELAGGEILSGIADAGKELRIKNKELRIEYEKINSYANLNLKKEKIDEILTNLGFIIKNDVAEIPAWRHDIAIWQDLAEEIYRINGLEKIPSVPLPEMQKAVAGDYHKKEKIKDYLAEIGLDEAISYTFLSDADVVAAKLDPSDLLEVANPVQDENRYLRNSLIPGLLRAIAKNPSFDDIEFFELGNVFGSSPEIKNEKEPTLSDRQGVERVVESDEWTSLALATSGKSARGASKIVTILSEKLKVKSDKFRIHEIDREELKRFKIKKPFVSVAEVKISDLLSDSKFNDLRLKVSDKKIEYRPISKFPPAKRDLAFVVGGNVFASEIRNLILETSPKAVLVEIFDEFIDKRFGENKKSVAFHVWLQDLNKTLSDNEAEKEISKIVSTLSDKFGAKLRD